MLGLLAPVGGALYDRFGARALLLPGTVVTSLALWSATLLGVHSPAAQILVFHLPLCAGLAFVFTPLFTAGLGALPARLYSYGSAVFGAAQRLAGAAGVALLVSVFSVRSAALAVPAWSGRRHRGGIHSRSSWRACRWRSSVPVRPHARNSARRARHRASTAVLWR
jgi:DHA2 family lincomycin resistance protein-like MFS transporter